jgi:hypothetical protein
MAETCFFKDRRLYNLVHSLYTRLSPEGHARELHAIHGDFWNMNTYCCICRNSYEMKTKTYKKNANTWASFLSGIKPVIQNSSIILDIWHCWHRIFLTTFQVKIFHDTYVAKMFHINTLYSTAHISQTFWDHVQQKVINHTSCLEIFNDSIG